MQKTIDLSIRYIRGKPYAPVEIHKINTVLSIVIFGLIIALGIFICELMFGQCKKLLRRSPLPPKWYIIKGKIRLYKTRKMRDFMKAFEKKISTVEK